MITTHYLCNRETVAPFVSGLLKDLEQNWLSITVTKPERSEEFCVFIATGMQSEDTVEILSKQSTTISPKIIQGG